MSNCPAIMMLTAAALHRGLHSLTCLMWLTIGLSSTLMLSVAALPLPAAEPSEPWAAEMAAFARHDEAQPFPANRVVFAGSSTIRLWDLAQSFPHLQPLNRGFGGSQMHDLLAHLDLVIIRHRPRAVVIYAGDNDIAAGDTPQQIVEEFQEVERRIHATLPDTQILYLSIKPSVSRWALYPQMQQVNQGIATYCQQQACCHYLELGPELLLASGEPDPNQFAADGLHLNASGYERWTRATQAALAPLLSQPAAPRAP